MKRLLDPKAILELGRLRRRLRQVEEDLGILKTAPSAPLLSRFGVEEHIEELVGDQPRGLISIHSENGDYLFAGQASLKLFGWTSQELVGQNAYAFFHEEDLEHIAEDHASHSRAKGAPSVVRYRLRQPDGRYRWVETRSKAILGATGIEQIICVTRPIDDSSSGEPTDEASGEASPGPA